MKSRSKKVIITLVLLSMVSMGFPVKDTSVYAFQPCSDKIIVDNEGDGDYLSIKEAVMNANPGDVIEVYSGDYYECNITILQPGVVLKGIPYELGSGNDSGKPFIHGGGLNRVIIIKADEITIDGFRIENSGTPRAYDVIIIENCKNCSILNNDISYSVLPCIACINSSNNQIIGNTIRYSTIRHGICISQNSNYNTIANNIITHMHKDGITVWGSAYNIISGNRISRCKRFGIDLPGGDYNTISRNSFDNNNVGIHVSGYHNVIKQNNFINNQKNAFFDMLLPLEFPFDNRWIKNYWDDWVGIGPKIIRGSILYFIPWFDFDWIHAREPYDTIENNN